MAVSGRDLEYLMRSKSQVICRQRLSGEKEQHSILYEFPIGIACSQTSATLSFHFLKDHIFNSIELYIDFSPKLEY